MDKPHEYEHIELVNFNTLVTDPTNLPGIQQSLKEKKAKINIEGSDGRAPIHLAIANGNIDIMDLLKKHCAKL